MTKNEMVFYFTLLEHDFLGAGKLDLEFALNQLINIIRFALR